MQTRRQFVRSGVAIAAAAPLISSSVTRALAESSRKKLGWAICGLGKLSAEQIAPALQKTEYGRLAGLITDSPDKAARWKTQYGIPDRNIYTYDTMERMADNRDIDVVYIVTPNALHLPHTLAAVKAGKHVYCEKPMEISSERCQSMMAACKAADRQLGIAYRLQYEPNNLECVRIARQKELGAVKIVEAGFCISVGDPNQWRLKKALAGGGALMDVGVYAVQAMRYLTGEEPTLICATESKTDPVKFAEVDESIVWQAKFPSGALAYCSTSYNAHGIARFRAQAERGWFELDPAFYYGGIRGRRSDGKEIKLPSGDQFAVEMDEFSRCILERRPPTRVSGDEGLRDVKIMMAIYESIRTGAAVKLA